MTRLFTYILIVILAIVAQNIFLFLRIKRIEIIVDKICNNKTSVKTKTKRVRAMHCECK